MLVGIKLRDRYQIIKLLGSGGFGETYLAEDWGIPINPKPKCVVKRLKTQDLNEEQFAWVKNSFEKEAATLYRLGKLHPQIPHLSEYFQENNQFYLVQDFIDGMDLSEIIIPGIKIPEDDVIQLLTETLEVLAIVHQQNIIHRDIKPQNIMCRRADSKIVLIDFGAVKEVMFTNTGQTSLTIRVGTAGYMPLEQFNGKPKLASDIYAMGIVCIQALTGIPPCLLDNDEDGEIIWQDKVSISSDFEQVLTKMVNRRASQRYSNATEALQAIQSLNQTSNKSIAQTFASSVNSTTNITPNTNITPTTNSSVIESIIPSNIPSSISKTTSSPLPLQKFQFQAIAVDERGRVIKRKTKEAKYFTEDLGNGIALEMVQIPEGTCMMGSPITEMRRKRNENIQHKVNVPSFFIGKYLVIQSQYQEIMGNNPAGFNGNNRPVEKVSWNDVVEFCRKLSEKTGRNYRLPSEAEWEYACRAGTTTPFNFGETINTDLVNYDGTRSSYALARTGTYRNQTTEVGIFPPNAFGLYDMHGNLWEWCEDTWHESYNNAPSDGSAWLGGDDNYRVLRGGSFISFSDYCRSAQRHYCVIRGGAGIYMDVGFRVVCSFGSF